MHGLGIEQASHKQERTVKGSCFCSTARALDASCHSLVTVRGVSVPAIRVPISFPSLSNSSSPCTQERKGLTEQADSVEESGSDNHGGNRSTERLGSTSSGENGLPRSMRAESDVVRYKGDRPNQYPTTSGGFPVGVKVDNVQAFFSSRESSVQGFFWSSSSALKVDSCWAGVRVFQEASICVLRGRGLAERK